MIIKLVKFVTQIQLFVIWYGWQRTILCLSNVPLICASLFLHRNASVPQRLLALSRQLGNTRYRALGRWQIPSKLTISTCLYT